MAVRIRAVCDDIDVLVPISNGLRVASLLPNGRFLALDGSNHVILSDDPAADRFADAVDEFLAPAHA